MGPTQGGEGNADQPGAHEPLRAPELEKTMLTRQTCRKQATGEDAHNHQEHARDDFECLPVFEEEPPDQRGSRSGQSENGREAEDEDQGADADAPGVGVELVYADPRDEGEVTGQEGQHAGAEEAGRTGGQRQHQ
jgi:hypothetical protein